MSYQTCLLTTTVFPHEAHVIASYLDSEGIETSITDEFTTQMDNFLSNAIGGVKIMVDPEDYERGLEALRKGGYLNREEEKPLPKKIEYIVGKAKDHSQCPYCNSDNIIQNQELSAISVFICFILSALLPIFKRHYICYDCNKRWRFVR